MIGFPISCHYHEDRISSPAGSQIQVIKLIDFSLQVSQLQYEVALKSDLIRVLNQQMNSESNEDLTAIASVNANYSSSSFQPIGRKWNTESNRGD